MIRVCMTGDVTLDEAIDPETGNDVEVKLDSHGLTLEHSDNGAYSHQISICILPDEKTLFIQTDKFDIVKREWVRDINRVLIALE